MTRFREPFPILYVDDVARSTRFWVDGLGFELVYRFPSDGEPEFAYCRLGETGVGLSVYPAEERFAERPAEYGAADRFELCVYADDVDEAWEQLQRHGARPLAAPADQPWGERLAYLESPDGHLLHVTAPIARP